MKESIKFEGSKINEIKDSNSNRSTVVKEDESKKKNYCEDLKDSEIEKSLDIIPFD